MPHSLLQQHFGFTQFRPGQEAVIGHLLGGHSSAAIFPTGSGKSLCYQLPALALPHLTLVISPLLALMQDQLAFLQSKGIAAASIDSSQSYDQAQRVMQQVRQGEIKILMISVERLKNERFRRFISQVPLSLLVVDEAHCISEWGHNFRPDYLKLPDYRRWLKIPQVLLLTATATPRVIEDMAARFEIPPQQIVTTGFYRPNLDLNVVALTPAERQPYLLEYLLPRQGQPTIVYVTQQSSADDLARYLSDHGVAAQAYHAGMDHPRRQSLQQSFMAGTCNTIVATIAFGMGVDKADIRQVVHFDLPKSIENYSQEIGRAGRDGERSECLLMANTANRSVLENFVYGDTPELAGIQEVVNQMAAAGPQWELLATALSNDSNVRSLPLRTLLVYLEMAGVVQPQYSYFAEVKFKLLADEATLLTRFDGERRQFLQALLTHSNKARTWYQPDFDALHQSYGSDRNRAMVALEYLADQQLLELQSKQMTEVYRVTQPLPPLPPLVQQLHQQFLDKQQSEIDRIAQMLALLQEPNCLSRALAQYFGDPDAPQRCGHCSACRGQGVSLPATPQADDESMPQYQQWLSPLAEAVERRYQTPLTPELASRFLAGIPTPWLGKLRARSLAGFGAQTQVPFARLLELCRQALA
ncbi:ATP-dependent DNA helicase RecQ [Ferrimonas sp. SCSIO 43195]|uniref:RecQ family ATP-dependent DNA helicase n=1 Tax=Ferrimonas sp. SCSIO 43195 TaxID=2822844 RepID=UPI0020762A4D|nr:RecQ family ATP-dependent DNA helicase [Ferrimonas sp. SCSIO 43195]USD37032.1 RecQ family ATP-dependent DNA helicase [Ferrimonas sp. SCSIO 43195]